MANEVSRRSFLKGSALVGAGAATASAFGALAGCSDATNNGGGGGAQVAQTASGISYASHSADVIVVGGGMAGLMAARTAADKGASVILVDKGPVGHSGNSGLLWGQTYVTGELTNDNAQSEVELYVLDVLGVLDQEQAKNVVLAQMESKPRAAIEQSGNVFQRGDDDQVIGLEASYENISVTHGAIYRQTAQYILRRGIPVFDNMMMLDILEDDEGTASGVIAISLKDGSAHIFRGKKTILCTGGYHWAAKSAGSPESTGEGHKALLKRGLAFKDMEFPQYDYCAIRPFGYRPDKERDEIQIGVSMPINGEVEHRICNKDKVPILGGEAQADGKQVPFQNAMIISAKEINNGNGSPGDGRGNGLYFSIADIENETNNQSYPSYKGFLKYSSTNLGYEYPEYVETIANQYSSCGVPQQNPETCESDIPGLYTVFVALSNFSSMWNSGQAYLAAKDAAAKSADLTMLPGYSVDAVDAVFSEAYSLLNAEHSDGIRATEVHRSIQRAFYEGQDFIKNGESIQAMIDELERIKAEDIPRMVCADKSRAFNGDWRLAMEVESMLTCSLGTAHAALFREETRSPFFRSDFPKMDNENWLCYVWVSMDEQGVWKAEKGPIVDTIVPFEQVAQMCGELDISVPN